MLKESFIRSYKDKVAPFGGDGLGWLTYKRTYSRLKEDGTSEDWYETVARCVNGAARIEAGLTEDEEKELFDLVFNLKGSFSGRALWQLGTEMVDKIGASSLNNCLAGDTRILTADGAKRIDECVGTARLMTQFGRWVDADVRSFGKQKLYKVSLKRGREKKDLFCTDGHRHYVTGRDRHIVKETNSLQCGDRLLYTLGQGVLGKISPSPVGIQHGIVYGDGSVHNQTRESGVTLCGAKDQQLLKWFTNHPAHRIPQTGKFIGTRVSKLPGFFKKPPPLNESKSYLYGWLAGYFAADGCVGTNGQATIHSAKKKNLELFRDVCSLVGIGTHKIRHQMRIGIGQTEPSAIYTLSLVGRTLVSDFFIIDKHRKRFDRWFNDNVAGETKDQTTRGRNRSLQWVVDSVEETDRIEEVYCAVVPDTHCFVLEDNILTGNCYFRNMDSIESFQFLMDNLMLGGGVGFSVERSVVHELPKVRGGVKITHLRTNDANYIVPDSREGWSWILRQVLKSYFETGRSFSYSTILIREYGAPLKTFGGTASGPGALVDGITDICKIMDGRAGKKLRSLDVLDVCNIIGRVVVAGSSRRSAQLATADPDDFLFLRAKRWDKFNIPAWRSNSNNSVYVDSYDQIIDELWNGYQGNGEPYGLVNRRLARRIGRIGEKVDDSGIDGFNPCAELNLEDGESCNLSEIFLPRIQSKKELFRVSELLYKVQKAITSLDYSHKITTDVVRRNRRLGQGVTGWMQSTPEQISWLDDTYKNLRAVDRKWSKERGISESIKLTTTKPSGTASLMPFVTPGVHPAYSEHFIRRIRLGSVDKLADLCREHGYPVRYDMGLDGRENHNFLVVEFPCQMKGALTAKDVTAVQQLEWVKKAQTIWSDNAVSVTVYYKKEELQEIRDWLKDNYEDNIKSVSFLLHSDHGFAMAPYEEISEEEYLRLRSKVKPLNSGDDIGSGDLDVECQSGVCPIK